MRRLIYVALPIVTFMMLAASAVLIAQHWQDFSGHTTSSLAPDSKGVSLASVSRKARVGSVSSRSDRTAAGRSDASPGSRAQGAPPAASSGAQAPAGSPAASANLAAATEQSSRKATEQTTSGQAAKGSNSAGGRKVGSGTKGTGHGSDTKGASGVAPTKPIPATGVNTTPEGSHPYFLERVVASGGIEYGTTRNRGVFISTDGGKTWAERSDGLPLRVVYPFKNDPIGTITAIGVDPLNGRHLAVTTEDSVYLSLDAGNTWKQVHLRSALKHSTYLTSVAVSPFQKSTVAVGTSFSGFFVTSDYGKHWVDHSKDLRFLYQGAGFYEEISALAYSPVHPGVMYLGVGFGGGVYRSTPDGKNWSSVDFPGGNKAVIRGMNVRASDSSNGVGSWKIRLATQQRYWSYDPAGGAWTKIGAVTPPPGPGPAKRKRMAQAANRAGIYISPWQANKSHLGHWIAFLKKNGLNTLVVDVKDDRGHITYNTKVPFARTIGAVYPYFNIEHLLRVAHENGIYVVGRLVVFKDKYMYRYEHHRYAIWDPKRNAPWGHYVKQINKKTGKVQLVQKEFWVDPFAERVWRYNLAVADELQKLGIDEIQFDYIRFPSEVTTKNAVYRFRRKGMSEENALESFLRMARSELKIPISVDLFGYNSWYPNAGWVGQDIEVYSNYADVISPMFYPSLFPRAFLSQLPYLKRARYLYRVGTWRSQRIVNGRAIIRPFVQSFLLGRTELKMDKTQYSEYLRTELEGAQEAQSSGFLLWNFGSDYYMVTFSLKPYVKR